MVQITQRQFMWCGAMNLTPGSVTHPSSHNFDSTLLNAGREDSAHDPLHFCEPVYAAINAVLLSMVCDGVACDGQ